MGPQFGERDRRLSYLQAERRLGDSASRGRFGVRDEVRSQIRTQRRTLLGCGCGCPRAGGAAYVTRLVQPELPRVLQRGVASMSRKFFLWRTPNTLLSGRQR